jgi:A/G-specific adenine glycosylase
MSGRIPADLTIHLFKWYDQSQRSLPWRGETDPYRVWLSEVMLQQTQVDTVIPYYQRWIDRFPDISSVAKADGDVILKLWEGLGYYRRARLFHSACQILVTDHAGQFPADPIEFRRLPGVGEYTFAAVRSICFGDVQPAVDGNLKRIIARVLCLKSTGPQLYKEVRTVLEKVISRERPGDCNQALMDLGSLICKPANPLCGQCPLATSCQAYATGTVAQYPWPTDRPARPHYPVAIGVVLKGDKMLISRRPENGLLGGLWEFPGGKVNPGEDPAAAVIREVSEEVGLDVTIGRHIGTINHGYTHFTITMDAYLCHWHAGTPKALGCTATRWVRWEEISDYPFPGANRKLFPLIANMTQ